MKFKTKASFILSLGKMPAKEIVARGRRSGMKFTVAYVYTVRRNRNAALRGRAKATAFTPSQLRRVRKTVEQAARDFLARMMRELHVAGLGDLASL